jgi:hypothetical protein
LASDPRKNDLGEGSPRNRTEPVLDCVGMEHCIAKIASIIAQDRCDRRSILQLGYNLGRLSELTGLGREAFWDRWKTPVDRWDRVELERLARDLQNLY